MFKQLLASAASAACLLAPAVAQMQGMPGHSGHGPAVDSRKIPQGSSGFSDERISAANEPTGDSDNGDFRTLCEFSHMAFDDPIVFPREPGKSHLHTFFGNTDANAFSTAASIAGSGNSTCRGGIANRSSYWVPAMIDTRSGAPVRPLNAIIYYKNGYGGIRPEHVKPFPKGLRMIAGDASNSAANGPYSYVCVGDGIEFKEYRSIPDCPVGSHLVASVFFPQCWDGKNLDSADHKRHMSDPVNQRCPESHPVPIPRITFNIAYLVTEPNLSRYWRLASDSYDAAIPGGRSLHADWFDGWRPEVKEAWVKGCNQAGRDCKGGLLGDGRMIY
jgi:hypothetical protein